MKRVEVRWLDSVTLAQGWHPRRRLPMTDRWLEHKTVGLLVRKRKRYIVVACSDGKIGTVNGCIAIPRRAITSMRRLRSKR